MINYRTAYKRFISSAKKKMNGIDSKQKIYKVKVGSDEKLEVHHIIPKRLGGSNKLKNLVLLSTDDHVYAHFLLNLALAQRQCYNDIFSLGYKNVPKDIPKMLKERKNIFRGLKIDMFIAGKKHTPTTMSIVEAARLFCIFARKNPNDNMFFDDMVTEVIKVAIFNDSKFGYKLTLHL